MTLISIPQSWYPICTWRGQPSRLCL